MLEIGGVLKWTFLYSTVHRMRSIPKQIKILPKRHDYLVLSKNSEQKFLENKDIYGLYLHEDTNLLEFERAMLEVGRETKRQQHDDLATAKYYPDEIHTESCLKENANSLSHALDSLNCHEQVIRLSFA
jgi:hypothetical protein